jgi:hypothetical protein
MAITINGTTGIAGVDGSAGTPAVQGADTNTGMFFPAADTIAFAEGGVEVARFNADAQFVTTAGTASLPVITTTGDVNTGIFFPAADTIAFSEGGAEAMRIDSSGNMIVGATSATDVGAGTPRLSLEHAGSTKWGVGPTSSFGNFYIKNAASTGVVLSTNATSWASDSDERKKTALVPFEDAAKKVCSLRAGTGRYLTDDESISRSFLIAQDVQAVLPEAVDVGEDKDKSLVLRYTDTIPLLVAAIQEQQALITQLQADVAALKGTP